MDRRKARRGYTLVEVLVVLAIFSIVLGLGTSEFSAICNSMRLRSSADALHASLYLTRSEAIKRNTRVVVCKSLTGTSCAASGGWEQGWIVFNDDNVSGQVEAGEEILHRESRVSDGIRLTGNSPVSTYVSYTSIGRTKLNSGAFQAGTFTICRQSKNPTDAYQIVINNVGRPRLAKTVISQCN